MQTQLSRPRAWALALTATLTLAVSYVDRQTFAVLAPTVQDKLHITDIQYGDWLVPAFSLAYLVGAPISGWLIDKVGARRGLLGAVLLWSVVAALHALAPGFGALLALRVALGVTESPSFPGAAQTVQRALPPLDRARGYGFLFTGSSVGAMVAPLLATYLEHRFNYRVAFLGTAIVGLSWVPVWVIMTNRSPAREVLDRVHVAEALPGRAAFGARGAGGIESVLEVARSPMMIRAALVIFASAPLLNLYINWGAKYLVHDHGLKQVEVGRYLWFGAVFYDLGSIFFGNLVSRARARGAVGVPPVLVFSAMAIMTVGVLVPYAGKPLLSMLLASVSMAGGGALYALTTSDLMARVPPQWVSTAGGLCATAQSVAYIAANPLIGRSVTGTGSYTQIFLLLTGWVIPLCTAWMLWKLPDPKPEVEGSGAG